MNNHLTPQQMLAYIDGELSRREARYAKRHLHSCWTCLAETERLKGDIASILDAQNEAFLPALPLPPNPWPGFETVLARHQSAQPPSLLVRFRAYFNELLSPTRIAVALVITVLLAVFGYRIVHVTTVSAKEALLKMQFADHQRSAITKDQVIRQRVHIRKTTHNQKPQKFENIDTWKSPTATYWNIEDKDSAAVDLRAQYQAHNIPMDLPLSAMSIDSWGKAVGGSPTISRQGADVGLTYIGSNEIAAGAVERVSLLIRPNWHIKQMTLDFSDASFEVTEDDYSVMSVSEVPAYLLAHLEPEAAPIPGQPPTLPASDVASSSPLLPMVNLDKAELDVFTTLHHLKADLGEPITVIRSRQAVKVGLWQLSPDRKDELRAALSDKAGVQLELASPRAQFRKESAGPEDISRPASDTPLRIQIESGDGSLRLMKYFGSLQKQQDFTNEALGASTSILSHLYALKNLQTQFPAERNSSLSPEEQQQLYSLVQDHVTAVTAHLEALTRQLAPLDTNFGVPTCTPVASSKAPTWQSGSLASLVTARSIDHLLRALLTASQMPAVPDSALPQINQNLCSLRAQLSGLDTQIIH